MGSGGYLYAYDQAKSDAAVYLEGTPAPLEDLGIPVPDNSVYAMTIDPEGKILYGLSYPDAEFFSRDIAAGKTVRRVRVLRAAELQPAPQLGQAARGAARPHGDART